MDTFADGTPRIRSHERRAYTDADKAAAMAMAALAGVRDAARELQIPERTIYEWCQQGGSQFAAIRQFVEARMAGAVSEAALSWCKALQRKADRDELEAGVLVRLYEATMAAMPLGDPGAPSEGGSLAGAQVWNIGDVTLDQRQQAIVRPPGEGWKLPPGSETIGPGNRGATDL